MQSGTMPVGSPLVEESSTTYLVSTSRPEIEEGQSSTVTVAIANGGTLPTDQTVSLVVSGTASADDYTLTPATLTLTAGEVQTTAELEVVDDQSKETTAETIILTAMIAGSSVAEATVTIHPSDRNVRTRLRNPIKGRIKKGDIVLSAAPFVRAPQTEDPPHLDGAATTDAYARIQYLKPVPGGNRLAFNDLRGILYMTDADGSTPVVYLDLRDEDVGFETPFYPSETGLMGFAFHPEFAASGQPGYGKFYTTFSADQDSGSADYLDNIGSHESVLREWTAADPDAATFAGTSREVLRVGQGLPLQNIGAVAFSSADYGKLYTSMGDGGGLYDAQMNGQDLSSPYSAILRIDPLARDGDRGYGIPADNPFALVPGIAGEIWAFGLRHPQHFSFDAAGRMFITDIGEDNIEEVNLGRAGANYGWRLREGTFATRQGIGGTPLGQGPVFTRPDETSGTFDYPVVQYDHDEGRALGSGFVYEGSAIPSLLGKYVFADLVDGRLFAVDADALTPGEQPVIEEVRFTFDGFERTLLDVAGYPNPSRLVFDPDAKRADLRLGLDHDGELYILTKGDGWIRRLAEGTVSDDATLSALSLSGIDIGTFSGDVTSYTASVEHAVETTTVTASATHASASVVITPGAEVNLSEGANAIQVTVTAEDETTTATYTVTVTRAAPPALSDDATLSALSLSGIDIGTFSGAVTSYAASVEHAVGTTAVTASATHASASVVITPGAEVSLSVGVNVIQVTVTAEDGTTAAYTVTVTRAEQQEEGRSEPLTATFESVPAEHTGAGSTFRVELLFSADVRVSNQRMQRRFLRVSEGTLEDAGRIDRRKDYWEFSIRPTSYRAVTLSLASGETCGEVICTFDGRPLSAPVTATIIGPPGLSVADAAVDEGAGAQLAFGITLDRAATGTVTVEAATADGTATAGEDYIAKTRISKTFAPGETRKVAVIRVLEDDQAESPETMTLTLSNATGAHIADGEGVGTIGTGTQLPPLPLVDGPTLSLQWSTPRGRVRHAVGLGLRGACERCAAPGGIGRSVGAHGASGAGDAGATRGRGDGVVLGLGHAPAGERRGAALGAVGRSAGGERDGHGASVTGVRGAGAARRRPAGIGGGWRTAPERVGHWADGAVRSGASDGAGTSGPVGERVDGPVGSGGSGAPARFWTCRTTASRTCGRWRACRAWSVWTCRATG